MPYLEPRAMDNAKKCISTFFAVPGPVVDYALRVVAVLESPSVESSPTASCATGSFLLRKMDSGNFGETSLELLASGAFKRNSKKNVFGDPEKLCFSSGSDATMSSRNR